MDGLSIAERLGDILQERHIKQYQLAEKTGLSPSLISDLLNEESDRKINHEAIIKICEALDISADYLLGLSRKDVKTRDLDARFVAEYTGLSDAAIKILHYGRYKYKNKLRVDLKWDNPVSDKKKIKEIIELLLCERLGNDLIDQIFMYLNNTERGLYTIDFTEYEEKERPDYKQSFVFAKGFDDDFYEITGSDTKYIYQRKIENTLDVIRSTYYDTESDYYGEDDDSDA